MWSTDYVYNPKEARMKKALRDQTRESHRMLNYKSPSPTKRTNSATAGGDLFNDQQYRKRGVRNQTGGQIVPETTMMPYESYMEVPYQPQGGFLSTPTNQWFPYVQPGAAPQWTQSWGFPASQSSPRGVQYVLPGTEGNNQGYVGYPNVQGETDHQQSGVSARRSDNVDMPRNSGHMMPSDPLLYLQQQQSQQQQAPQQLQIQQQQQKQQQQQQQQTTESSAVLTTLLNKTPNRGSSQQQQQQTTPGQQATPPSQVNSESESTSSERLPAFDQAFSQTGIGRFSHEGFHNNNNNKQSCDLPVVEGDLGLDLTFKMEYQSRNGYPFSPNPSMCDYLYGGATGAAMSDTPTFNYPSYDRDYNQNRL